MFFAQKAQMATPFCGRFVGDPQVLQTHSDSPRRPVNEGSFFFFSFDENLGCLRPKYPKQDERPNIWRKKTTKSHTVR